ncbi:hypothetical protein HK104_010410 [Borealophlyctis nickersoniae]|nr:hypothetical protein HK104_010410 [Borealophlyctis nickersoniae]
MKSDDVLKKMDEIMLSEDATPSLTADLKSQEKPTSPPPDSSNVSKPLLPAAAPPSEKDPKSEPTIDRKEGTPSSVNDGGNKSEPKPALPPNRVDAKDDISEEIDESIEEDIDESSEPDPKSESDFITSDRSVSPSLSTGEFDHSELVE